MSAPPDPGVLAECRATLARGSKSFRAASIVLPRRLRDPVAAYYAFCRVSDDAVDASDDPARALALLRGRLDAIAAGAPGPDAADRGLAWVMQAYAIPRTPLDALLEGYAWDAAGRRYETLGDVRAYGARVAGSVGVVMSLIMGRRAPAVLARAAELGVAMQLTNIARDVGEDARAGRVYLPLAWLREEGISAQALLAQPGFTAGLGVCVARLLEHADVLYRRAAPGIAALPRDCRWAIASASAIYADIGRAVRERGYDSVSARAFTRSRDKVWRIAAAAARALPERAASCHDAPPLPEVRFLLSGVAS
ncbi:MAG: phytoene/squalene synthase family protein [Sandaracinaceae bacterium]|nr:phytoene/squalene synthase family protein [Sandaracinaceae bacterium]